MGCRAPKERIWGTTGRGSSWGHRTRGSEDSGRSVPPAGACAPRLRVTLHERAAESGPAPAPFGRSHDANSYQVRPEEGMSRAASHDSHCPLSVPAEKQAFEVNSHLLWGLTARMPVFHEGHFINHSKSKPVREERKRKDALEKHRHLPVP